MSQTASREKFIAVERWLMVAFELGWTKWRLAFGAAMGQKPWQITIPARNFVALSEAIGKARQRLGLPDSCPVFSCYEAGREGFWLHRLLEACAPRLQTEATSARTPEDQNQNRF